MNPVQYILVERDNGMSAGKLAAQVAHAAVEGYRLSCKQGPNLSDAYRRSDIPENHALFEETSIVNRWRRGGHYTKVVLACADLYTAREYIRDRNFKTALIIDEGRTEVAPLTPTALGVEIVDKDSGHVQDTFGIFRPYREPADAIDVVALAREAGWRPPSFWHGFGEALSGRSSN